jgi:hypothetical protein
LNVLRKEEPTRNCIPRELIVDTMPTPICIRFKREDMKNTYEAVRLGMGLGYPGYYGLSEYDLSIKFNGCQCTEFGKYQLSFSGSTVKEKIEIILSNWRYPYRTGSYSIEYWYEQDWGNEILQDTYEHEATHVRNARRMAAAITAYAKKDFFGTKTECEKNVQNEKKIMGAKWKEWYENEQNHENPNSPF